MGDEGRALLTDRERDILRGDVDVTDNYRYKVQSLARQRVRKRLAEDIEILRDTDEQLYRDILDMTAE